MGDLYAKSHYVKGELVPPNDVEAAKWFRKAAERGDSSAQVEMALRYEHGLGVPKDEVEAAKWFRKIAKEASSSSLYDMGKRYITGKGVPEDLVKAYMWFIVADAKGADVAWGMGKIEGSMTKDQIAKAKKLSREWLEDGK